MNGKRYKVGLFVTKRIEELQIAPNIFAGGGTFNMILGEGSSTFSMTGSNTKNLEYVDVGALQMQISNRGATFQVASNFNCLELVHSQDQPKFGVTKYIYDLTQGPAASISCAPATVFRNYFLPHQDPDGNEVLGQLAYQVNLLDGRLSSLELEFPVIPIVNGYVEFDRPTIKVFRKEKPDFQDFGKVKIGLQRFCQVTRYGFIHPPVEKRRLLRLLCTRTLSR